MPLVEYIRRHAVFGATAQVTVTVTYNVRSSLVDAHASFIFKVIVYPSKSFATRAKHMLEYLAIASVVATHQ